LRALVVDDAPFVRRFLSEIVHALHFEAIEAEDGVVALEVLRGVRDVAVLLVNWNMPNMNGLEFIKAVRGDPAFAGTKIIMVSTRTEMDDVIQALDAGADEYLMKPFTKEAVAEKLALLGLGAS
jgi:two-component system chemotaxis response regulator CheY